MVASLIHKFLKKSDLCDGKSKNKITVAFFFLIPMTVVMTFLINLGVTEILYSFRLVLEGKTGKEMLELSHQD